MKNKVSVAPVILFYPTPLSALLQTFPTFSTYLNISSDDKSA